MSSPLSDVSLDEIKRPLLETSIEPAVNRPSKSQWLPKTLIALDNILDVIPFGSTANNLVDLGLKHLVIKDMPHEESSLQTYIEHLKKKESSDCVIIGVPFVGNVYKIGKIVYETFSQQAPTSTDLGQKKTANIFEIEGDFSTIGERLKQQEAYLHSSYGHYDPDIYQNFTSGTI